VNNSRDEIITSLRNARGKLISVPHPVAAGINHFNDRPAGDLTSCLQNFKERLAALKGETYIVGSKAEARSKISELTQTVSSEEIVYSNEPIVQEIADGATTVMPLDELPDTVLKNCKVGITGCLSLVTRTGSVVVSSTLSGRRLSVLPPFHIVVAESSQMEMSLENVFPKLESDPLWSYAVVITGPSRTADIEKILVLGAHGPKRFAVIIIDA